jgi:hypothetical protein
MWRAARGPTSAALTCVVVQDPVECVVHEAVHGEVARECVGLPRVAPGRRRRLPPSAGLQTPWSQASTGPPLGKAGQSGAASTLLWHTGMLGSLASGQAARWPSVRCASHALPQRHWSCRHTATLPCMLCPAAQERRAAMRTSGTGGREIASLTWARGSLASPAASGGSSSVAPVAKLDTSSSCPCTCGQQPAASGTVQRTHTLLAAAAWAHACRDAAVHAGRPHPLRTHHDMADWEAAADHQAPVLWPKHLPHLTADDEQLAALVSIGQHAL